MPAADGDNKLSQLIYGPRCQQDAGDRRTGFGKAGVKREGGEWATSKRIQPAVYAAGDLAAKSLS